MFCDLPDCTGRHRLNRGKGNVPLCPGVSKYKGRAKVPQYLYADLYPYDGLLKIGTSTADAYMRENSARSTARAAGFTLGPGVTVLESQSHDKVHEAYLQARAAIKGYVTPFYWTTGNTRLSEWFRTGHIPFGEIVEYVGRLNQDLFSILNDEPPALSMALCETAP